MRSRQILKLRETKDPNPYPHKFDVSISIPEYIKTYGAEGKIPPGTKLRGTQESLAGRLHNMRASSQKLRFYDLHAEGVKVQIMASAELVYYNHLHELSILTYCSETLKIPKSLPNCTISSVVVISLESRVYHLGPRRVNYPFHPHKWFC